MSSPALMRLNSYACACVIWGCAGFVSLIILNHGVGKPHSFSTNFTYASFGASTVFMLPALILKSRLTRSWPRWWQILVIYAQLIGILGIALLFTETDVFSGAGIDPAFFANKFWDWMYTFAIIGWLVEIALVMPRWTKGS
ncbi:MAG: hypothetical protein Q6373_023040 [Candidatus Sigynarchaeota archaeon]